MERVGGPLKGLLTRLRLTDAMMGWRAVQLWPEVVGERVASRSKATAFRDGVLIVEVESHAWMSELGYLKRRIVEDLNRQLGDGMVREIRLQPAARNRVPDAKETNNQ